MEQENKQNQQDPFGINEGSIQEQEQKHDKHRKLDPRIEKINERLGETSRSLRMLEERYITLRKKTQVSDQNIIDDTNKIFTRLKLIVKDINDLKLGIEDIRQKLEIFSNEIKGMAPRQDLKVLQKYVEMWQPIQFLTEKEAIRLIRDKIESESGKNI